MADFQILAEGLKFPEGPIALPNGDVLVVEIAGGRVTRLTPDGQRHVVAQTGGGPNGAALGPDGKLYVCNNGGFDWAEVGGMLVPAGTPADYAGGSIQRVDLATGAVETLYTHCGDERLKGPNDIVFDRQGGFWFTDNGKRYPRSEDVGAVYYARTDGSFISEQIYPTSHANGIALSPDEKTLYVAETMAGRIWAFPITAPGKAEGPAGLLDGSKLLYGAPGFRLYDSMAVEANGHICQATLADGGISVISPHGALVDFISLPDPAVTNICFGGPDMRTAYITLSCTGKLIRMAWPRPGLRLNFSAT